MKNQLTFLIEKHYADMRASEQKAADYILQNMPEVRGLTLTALAEQCMVSQPTVVRMAKALGFSGFREFHNVLVEELAQAKEPCDSVSAMYGYTLTKKDRLEDIPARVVSITEHILEETLKNFSVSVYQEVIDALKNAGRIGIYSVENSNATAIDLLTKLMYLGLHCCYYEDYYHQCISAGNLSHGDVAVGISYSGYSRDTVEVMKEAKHSGATTIVLTNFPDSRIIRYADIVLCTGQDQTFYGDAIFSRTAQIMIVDILYNGLIVSDYDRFVRQLDKSSRAIRDKAYPKDSK